MVQAQLDELNKATANGAQMTAAQKQQFIDVNRELKLLMDRRSQILARTGDDFVADPPRLPSKL